MTEHITQKRLKELLSYNGETGEFIRLKYARKDGIVGWSDELGYIHIRADNILYLAHRLAWLYIYGEWPKNNIDHINGISSDNRITNLRNANQAQNMRNTSLSKANKSGRKGISWDRERDRWRATIQFDGNWKQVGRFECFCSAIKARAAAEKRWHGEFSRGANV